MENIVTPSYGKLPSDKILSIGSFAAKACLAALAMAALIIYPADAAATQLHVNTEGIIVHQVGHLCFLMSMVALIFTVTGKGLDSVKGWRLIQYSAFFFVLWNLDAIAAHFLDNQIAAVSTETISIEQMRIITRENSPLLAKIYYILKLDHLLCVPAMFLLYRGLSLLASDYRRNKKGQTA